MLLRFLEDQKGGIAITAAVSISALVGVAGLAVDYALFERQKSELQAAVDSAAIAGARELAISRMGSVHAINAAKAFLRRSADVLQSEHGLAAEFDSRLGEGGDTVIAEMSQPWRPLMLHHLKTGTNPIVVSAAARINGGGNVCILGLATNISKTIFLDHTSQINANGCAVYANSNISDAIRTDSSGRIVASMICSAGGALGTAGSFTPVPTTDCPIFQDPLRSRPEPAVGACDHDGLEIKDETRSLTPGVYCNGLKISGTANVTLTPGVYVIKGAKLHVQDTARMYGEYVGFHMADANALFEFTEGTTIWLSAPKDGALGGILFFDTRTVSVGRKHRINSNNATRLIGTFYLPNSTLLVDSKAPVAQDSAFTAIVAYSLELLEAPNLVLNSNYDATDVPVPGDLVGGRVTLVR